MDISLMHGLERCLHQEVEGGSRGPATIEAQDKLTDQGSWGRARGEPLALRRLIGGARRRVVASVRRLAPGRRDDYYGSRACSPDDGVGSSWHP
jgi:hypothetical protein